MLDLLTWLEGSALGQLMRSSGVWAYGVVNLIHIVGIAALFGSILVLDLRLLGVRPGIPLSVVATLSLPVAAAGFAMAALSGICLITANATEYAGNPFLLIKFPAIGLGLINAAVISRLPAWKARAVREPTAGERLKLAVAGGISLASWLTAISAGRMIGYW